MLPAADHHCLFNDNFSLLVLLAFLVRFVLRWCHVTLKCAVATASITVRTYFQPSSWWHTLQNISRTTCSPVISTLSSLGPTDTLTLRMAQRGHQAQSISTEPASRANSKYVRRLEEVCRAMSTMKILPQRRKDALVAEHKWVTHAQRTLLEISSPRARCALQLLQQYTFGESRMVWATRPMLLWLQNRNLGCVRTLNWYSLRDHTAARAAAQQLQEA